MKYRALRSSQVIVTCGRAAAAIGQLMLLLVPQQIEKKNPNPNKPQQNKKTLNVLLFVPLCHTYQNANASNLTLA